MLKSSNEDQRGVEIERELSSGFLDVRVVFADVMLLIVDCFVVCAMKLIGNNSSERYALGFFFMFRQNCLGGLCSYRMFPVGAYMG